MALTIIDVDSCINYMTKRKLPRAVREPVQVYLDPDDRKLLDSLARPTGLSRAEILRRGIRSLAAAARGAGSPMLAFIEERVLEMPEQYYWVHRRFKTRPQGEPGVYG